MKWAKIYNGFSVLSADFIFLSSFNICSVSVFRSSACRIRISTMLSKSLSFCKELLSASLLGILFTYNYNIIVYFSPLIYSVWVAKFRYVHLQKQK